MTNTTTTTTTMNTTIPKEIKDFAIQYLGLQFDEQENVIYSIYGQGDPWELVGTRRIYSEEYISKRMDDCCRNY